MISNTLSLSLSETIQEMIRADTLNVTKLVKKMGNLLQQDHHETIRVVSSILAKGKELANSLQKINGSTTQIIILIILLGVIVFLGLVNLCATHCTKNAMINRLNEVEESMIKERKRAEQSNQSMMNSQRALQGQAVSQT